MEAEFVNRLAENARAFDYEKDKESFRQMGGCVSHVSSLFVLFQRYVIFVLVCRISLNYLVYSQAPPVDTHDELQYLLPTFVGTVGGRPDLVGHFDWTGYNSDKRMSGTQFLSTALTLSMKAAYPDGNWRKRHSTLPLPANFGEQNIRNGAVQVNGWLRIVTHSYES